MAFTRSWVRSPSAPQVRLTSNSLIIYTHMGKRVKEFQTFRTKMNERILGVDNRAIKRFFGVDTLTYEQGKLDVRTKEMLGLVASMVLRCDDCVSYHLVRCKEEGISDDELFEVFSVGLIVGGSIVIPHLRRAVAFLDDYNSDKSVSSKQRKPVRVLQNKSHNHSSSS